MLRTILKASVIITGLTWIVGAAVMTAFGLFFTRGGLEGFSDFQKIEFLIPVVAYGYVICAALFLIYAGCHFLVWKNRSFTLGKSISIIGFLLLVPLFLILYPVHFR